MDNSSIAPPSKIDLELLRDYASRWPKDSVVGCMECVANSRGIKTERVQLALHRKSPRQEWLRLTIGKQVYIYRSCILRVKRKRLIRYHWEHINRHVPGFTINKEAVKTHLREHGYSVSTGQMFTANQGEEALNFFKQLGCPVCIKPNNGAAGRCVFTPVKDEEFFRLAFGIAAANYSEIIVEEHVEGENYRFFYVKPHVIGVLHDTTIAITGDGQHTIAELIETKNQERARRRLPSHGPILVNDDLVYYIGAQDIELTDVIPAGKKVALRGAANANYGGESSTRNQTIHPSYLRLFEEICATIPDLQLTAFDVIVRAVDVPAHPDNYKILEMNSAPGVERFYFPWNGESQDVCGVMLDKMMKGEW